MIELMNLNLLFFFGNKKITLYSAVVFFVLFYFLNKVIYKEEHTNQTTITYLLNT